MKKHFTTLCTLLLAACALTFVSCGDDDENVEPTPVKPTPVVPTDPTTPVITIPESDPSDYGTMNDIASVATGSYKDNSYMSTTVLSSLKSSELPADGVPAVLYGINRSSLKTMGTLVFGEETEGGKCETHLSGLVPGQVYYYVACYTVDGEPLYYSGDIRCFAAKDLPTGAVDLGLSVKWSACNIGADTPNGYGQYFAWGETAEKPVYDYNTCETYSKSLDLLKAEGYVDANGNLTAEHDAATAASEADEEATDSWRMPTKDEVQELMTKCEMQYGTYNSVNGIYFTGTNGEIIFLPASGIKMGKNTLFLREECYYWSATSDEGNYATYTLAYLEADEDADTDEKMAARAALAPIKVVAKKAVSNKTLQLASTMSRTIGMPIRPVQK